MIDEHKSDRDGQTNWDLIAALVSVLPELLSETNPRESFKQLGCIFFGILIMFFLSFL